MQTTSPFSFRKINEAFWPIAVLLLLLLYSYARLIFFPYAGFQFNASSGEIVGIFVSQSATPRLELGDNLIEVNGRTWTNYVADSRFNLFAGLEPDQPILLEVKRGNENLALNWVVPGFTVNEFLARFLNNWILGYVFWLAGTATVLLVRPKNERWLLLTAFFYVTAIWLSAGSVSSTHLFESPFVLRFAIWLSLPIYVHMHWNFPRSLGKLSKVAWFAFYLLSLVLALLQWADKLPHAAYVLAFGLAIILSGAILLYRLAFRPGDRREIILLFLAAVFALVPALVIAFLSGGEGVSAGSAGLIFSVIVLPGAYFYVVYRKQLGGAELRANRLISIYLFLVVLITLFLGLLPLFSGYLQSPASFGAAILLTGIAGALVSLFGFTPFQRFVEHRLLRIPRPPLHLLSEFAGRISTSFTPEHLAEILEKEVLPGLLIRRSTLLRFDADKSKSQAVYLQDLEQKDLPILSEQEEILRLISSNPDRTYSPSEHPWLHLAISLQVGMEIVGLWLLGRKDPDDIYSYAEQELLKSLADQMAIALVNISQAKNLRALYQVDIERTEDERAHLARELHDDVLNELNDLVSEAGQAIQSKEFDSKQHALDDRIRNMIHGLRPPMLSYGLYQALNELVDDLTDKAQGKVQLEIDLPSSEVRFDAKVEEHIYRIVQQACENTLKHGMANLVSIKGELRSESVEVSVQDDGQGFQLTGTSLSELLAERHYGLAGMSERAALIGAQLEIVTSPGKGTFIRLTWTPPIG